MTMFAYISHNIDRVKYDIKIGLISCTVLKHWQIYSRYEYYRRLKLPSEDAVMGCCSDFAVERSWVYKIIKRMESEI